VGGGHGSLIDRITSVASLDRAWTRVRVKAARGGIDGRTIEHCAANASDLLDELRRDLRAGKVCASPAGAGLGAEAAGVRPAATTRSFIGKGQAASGVRSCHARAAQ